MPQCNFNPFLFWRGHTRDPHETCPSHTGCCGAADPGTAAVSRLAWHWGWANLASNTPTQQPLQLPPPASNVGKVGNHVLETIFFFPLLLPALSSFPLILPELADSFPTAIISEARIRPSPLPCRGRGLFSWMI